MELISGLDNRWLNIIRSFFRSKSYAPVAQLDDVREAGAGSDESTAVRSTAN